MSLSDHQTATEVEPTRIRDVVVNNLFGLFNHHIHLNLDEGITIIHGPNGVGKTRVLQLLAALPRLQFGEIRRTPLDSLTVSFSDGSELEIVKQRQGVLDVGEPANTSASTLTVRLTRPGGRTFSSEFGPNPTVSRLARREIMRLIDSDLPFLAQIGPERWLDESAGETLRFQDVVARYSDSFPVVRHLEPDLNPDIEDFLKSLRIEFIETSRLTSTVQPPDARTAVGVRVQRSASVEPTVTTYARDLSGRLERVLADNTSMSSRLDRTFPNRAIAEPVSEVPDTEAIQEKYETVTRIRERLTNAGLLERSDELPWPNRVLNETERHFLDVYFNDAIEKLSLFSALLEKLELLEDILNLRFLYKRIKVDRGHGFTFISPGGESVPPNELSSGEQHELIFAYRMLFRTTPGSLVLIDEPEISLHVGWQQRFLRDLARIKQLSSLDFMIATHAPELIYDRGDLTQRLGGPTD